MIQCRLKHLQARCRERGYSFDEVRDCIVEQNGDRLLVDEHHPSYPTTSRSRGPGAELRALLKEWLGIEAAPGCSCNLMAARMDALGVDWCESDAGMTEIIRVMRDEHFRRKSAGETVLPWSTFAVRQLVHLACRKARVAQT
jgi:hypothetical protein